MQKTEQWYENTKQWYKNTLFRLCSIVEKNGTVVQKAEQWYISGTKTLNSGTKTQNSGTKHTVPFLFHCGKTEIYCTVVSCEKNRTVVEKRNGSAKKNGTAIRKH